MKDEFGCDCRYDSTTDDGRFYAVPLVDLPNLAAPPDRCATISIGSLPSYPAHYENPRPLDPSHVGKDRAIKCHPW